MIKAFTILLFPLLFHPVHVSMSSLTLIPDGSGFELVVRASSNDLAIDIWRIYQPDEKYFEDHSFIGPDQFYCNYVNDNLMVRINSKVVKGELINVEILEIETVIKLLVPINDAIASLKIENNLFTVLSPDQVNLFIYKDDSVEKSFRFTAEDNSVLLFDK